MENLQQRRSSSPDLSETSSSLYSDFQPPEIPKKTAEVKTPSTAITSLPSSGIHKKNSILRKSLSLLNRSEEKKSQSQLVKVHTFTIYDEEKDKFIEITEEEWEGDGPPPRKSTDSQKKNILMIDKALPSIPELPSGTEKENLITKFNQWLKNKHPYVYKYRLPIFILLMILFIALLLIIIILASTAKNNGNNGKSDNPTGTDRGKPGLNMTGTGDGTYYGKNLT